MRTRLAGWFGVIIAFAVWIISATDLLAAGKFEPESGCYLGVLLDDGGTESEILDLNEDAARGHAVYAKFVVFKRDPFPTNWINTIKAASPGCGAHIILEPFTDFEDFFAANWGPGQSTYEAARSFAVSCRDAQLPIFLRFAHEANGWWYPWSPSYSGSDLISNHTYIVAWTNFAHLVHTIASNVAMVWGPNQGNGPGELPHYGHIYPGDGAVDWVGLTVYNGDWYGNYNNVMDYEFRNAIERGYWQNDGNPSNDTAENFYWTYAAPNNPAGHRKPMMISETASQFVPQYRIETNITIASFETLNAPQFYPTKTIAAFQDLNSDGWAAKDPITVDGMESITPWHLGMYGKKLDVVPGLSTNCFKFYTTNGVTGWELGWIARGAPFTNWSSRNGCEYWVRRDTSTNVDPVLQFHYTSFSSNYYLPSKYSLDRTITSTNWMPVRIPYSEVFQMLYAGGTWVPFDWRSMSTRATDGILGVGQSIIVKTSTSATSTPGAVFVDRWSLVNLTNAPYVDQDWWPGGPDCTPWADATETNTTHAWALVADPFGGLTNSLRMTGTDAGNFYIGGNGCTLRPEFTNWSAASQISILMRRAVTNRVDPALNVVLVDFSNRQASFVQTVWSTNYSQYVLPRSAVTVTPGFDWARIKEVFLHMLTTVGGSNPAPMFIKNFQIGTTSVTTVEQDWWPAGTNCVPWGDVTWTRTTNRMELAYGLRMHGADANGDWYVGGNGCSMSVPEQNWTNQGCNALVLWARRGTASGVPDPELKITLDNDYTEMNGNEAWVKTRFANNDFRRIIISYDDFKTDASFHWGAVRMLKLELFTSIGGQAPAELFIDHLQRSRVVVSNGADNLKWKIDWMRQLYSLVSFSDANTNNPDYLNIATNFPNIHMINWFHVKKFEDGQTKDFRVVADGTNPLFKTYNGLVRSNYFLSTVNQPLAAHWTCDETAWTGAAGEVTDDSGNWNHGRAFNGATTTSDAKAGRAGWFDGTNDYAEIPNGATLQVRSNLTICFWLKGRNLGSARFNPVDKNYGGEFALTIETNRALSYYHGTARASGKYVSWTALPAGSVTNNAWMHIAITRDSGTRQLRSYVNGVLRRTTTYASGTNYVPTASTYPVRLARGYTGACLRGQLDEVQLYNRVLSQSEIMALVTNP